MIARLFVVGCALIIPSSMILGSPLDFGFAQGWRAQSIAVHSDGGGVLSIQTGNGVEQCLALVGYSCSSRV